MSVRWFEGIRALCAAPLAMFSGMGAGLFRLFRTIHAEAAAFL
jgi:hypothetical protein